jgi:arylsulfatase A-like enzyme
MAAIGRREFIRGVAGGALAATWSARTGAAFAPAPRPSILFLLVDDLGWSDLACYGNTFHETPNIDALAASGVRFTQAYAACAVCSPTRASIMTGKYPVRLGITDWIPGEQHPDKPLVLRDTRCELPLGETTLAEAFRGHGYRTAYVGKWHLGGRGYFPEAQGFDVNIAGHEAGQPPGGYFSPYKIPNLADGPDGEYLTDRLASESIHLLEGYAREPERPFLLYHAFYTVHMPLQARADLKKRYEDKASRSPDPRWKNTTYAAMVHGLDENVGRLLAALDRLKLVSNTVIVLTSDNGGVDYSRVTTNYPLRAGKGRYYEGGIRVPLIVRPLRATTAPGRSDEPVISNDFYPTLLEMAGLPLRPAQHLDGRSMAPLLAGRGVPRRDALYWHYPHYHGSGETPSSAIRVGDLKLVRHYESGLRELFDLRRDVSEATNLAASQPATVRDLDARLDSWLASVGGYVPTPKRPGAADAQSSSAFACF